METWGPTKAASYRQGCAHLVAQQCRTLLRQGRQRIILVDLLRLFVLSQHTFATCDRVGLDEQGLPHGVRDNQEQLLNGKGMTTLS